MERNYLINPLTVDDINNFKIQQSKYKNDKIYNKEDEIVFIHKTNYAPSNNEIKSVYSSLATYTANGILFDIKFKYEYPIGYDYIHFSMNCEVSGKKNNDIYGFNNRKYAVIVPGSEEEFKKISRFSINDVEFKGVKDISNCYLLCPIKEYNEIKNNNSNVNVIPYVGDYVDGYAETFINMLGYTTENTDDKNCTWFNKEESISNLLNKYGFTFSSYGIDKFISNKDFQQSLKYNCFFKKIVSVMFENNINIFDVISNIDQIVDDNKISLTFLKRKPNQVIDSIVIEKEEENIFWNKFLKNNTSYNKYFLIYLISN